MARVKGGTVTRKRRKKVLKLAKGYYGSKHTLFKTAKEQVMNSYNYAYRDRRQKKRDFRKLWIARINAAARMNGLSYSKLMHGLKLAEIDKQGNKKEANIYGQWSFGDPSFSTIYFGGEHYWDIDELTKNKFSFYDRSGKFGDPFMNREYIELTPYQENNTTN